MQKCCDRVAGDKLACGHVDKGNFVSGGRGATASRPFEAEAVKSSGLS